MTGRTPDALAKRCAYLDALQTGSDARDRLQRGVDLLPGLVPGCQCASAVTASACGLEKQVSSGVVSRRADDLQRELNEGPSLHAFRHGHSVFVQDLLGETRWPHWTSRVTGELQLSSSLSVLLLSSSRVLGLVNFYSVLPASLSNVDIAELHALTLPLLSTLNAS